jgi:hypothetical protein
LLGLAFLLFDPTRRVYNHVVCARSLGFFFFFFFFFCFFLFCLCTDHQKVGSNTSEPSVCVYVKMDTKETKRKKKTCCCCCCTISSKENQKRESDSREFTTPPPFCQHYLTSKKKKRNRDFDLDFFDQLTSIRRVYSFNGGVSFGNFIAPLRSYWVGVSSSSLSLWFFILVFLVGEATGAIAWRPAHTRRHSSGHLVELLIWQPR